MFYSRELKIIMKGADEEGFDAYKLSRWFMNENQAIIYYTTSGSAIQVEPMGTGAPLHVYTLGKYADGVFTPDDGLIPTVLDTLTIGLLCN